MRYMNDYDVILALQACDPSRPVLSKAVRFLADFKDEVDSHSDGWCYWRAPVVAARRLIELIPLPYGIRAASDITEAQYRYALVPIKSFFTQKGKAAGMILPPTNI